MGGASTERDKDVCQAALHHVHSGVRRDGVVYGESGGRWNVRPSQLLRVCSAIFIGVQIVAYFPSWIPFAALGIFGDFLHYFAYDLSLLCKIGYAMSAVVIRLV